MPDRHAGKPTRLPFDLGDSGADTLTPVHAGSLTSPSPLRVRGCAAATCADTLTIM